MLRSAIAAVLVVTLAMLVLPCGFAVIAQHASHACCAPALIAHSADCCNSAAPHPVTAPALQRSMQAAIEESAPGLPQFVEIPNASFPILALSQPAKHPPATILRT